MDPPTRNGALRPTPSHGLHSALTFVSLDGGRSRFRIDGRPRHAEPASSRLPRHPLSGGWIARFGTGRASLRHSLPRDGVSDGRSYGGRASRCRDAPRRPRETAPLRPRHCGPQDHRIDPGRHDRRDPEKTPRNRSVDGTGAAFQGHRLDIGSQKAGCRQVRFSPAEARHTGFDETGTTEALPRRGRATPRRGEARGRAQAPGCTGTAERQSRGDAAFGEVDPHGGAAARSSSHPNGCGPHPGQRPDHAGRLPAARDLELPLTESVRSSTTRLPARFTWPTSTAGAWQACRDSSSRPGSARPPW